MQQPPDFVDYPTPSPTSQLGINVRYYHITSETGQEVYWDLGEEAEKMVESCYHPSPVLTPELFGTMLHVGIEAGLLHGVEFMPLVLIHALAVGNTGLFDTVIEQHKKILGQIGTSIGTLPPPEPPTTKQNWKVW